MLAAGRIFAVSSMLVLAAVGQAAAQACIGSPAPEGSIAIEGLYNKTEGAQGFGGNLTLDMTGPLTIQGGYAVTKIDDSDEDFGTFSGLVAFEVPKLSFSACPLVGVSYSSFTTSILDIEIEATEMVVPVGVGLGKTFAAGSSMGFTLFAIPQYLYIRDTIDASEAGVEEETETSSEFGSVLGFRLGTSKIFGGGSVLLTSIEDSDPVFTISLAFAFGGRQH